ncbi:PIM1 kinase, partial [Anthoscopus minutus]|nr:PIM1 kinase [Anthoscopus minutus]
PAGKVQEAFHERYRLGSLLGHSGFGSVYTATRLLDGTPVSGGAGSRHGTRGPTDCTMVLPQPDGTSAPLEILLLDKVSTGF